MRYIDTFREGMHIADVYLCKNKQIALTKNGKEYGNLVMQDKTGTIDAKIWDLGSPGVGEFETMDYVHVEADVTLFQLNVRRIRRAQEGEYVEADYLPVSKKDIKKMYEELLGYIRSVKNPYLQKLLSSVFPSRVHVLQQQPRLWLSALPLPPAKTRHNQEYAQHLLKQDMLLSCYSTHPATYLGSKHQKKTFHLCC